MAKTADMLEETVQSKTKKLKRGGEQKTLPGICGGEQNDWLVRLITAEAEGGSSKTVKKRRAREQNRPTF